MLSFSSLRELRLPGGTVAQHRRCGLSGVVEIQEVRIGSKVGGRVNSVEVSEGQTVDAGTILVTFETPELEAQRHQWQAMVINAEADLEKLAMVGAEGRDAAKATMQAAEARLQRLKAGWRKRKYARLSAILKARSRM